MINFLLRDAKEEIVNKMIRYSPFTTADVITVAQVLRTVTILGGVQEIFLVDRPEQQLLVD